MEDTRYPYTHACDYIRMIAGYNTHGTKISRSDASNIRQEMSKILGIDDEEMANRLADYYLENKDKLAEQSAKDFQLAIRYGEI